MRLWHATRDLTAVLKDGWVRPMRLEYVYAFTTKEAADRYATDFDYEAVVEVALVAGEGCVRGRWTPTYANGADVVCIRGRVKVVVPGYVDLGDCELTTDEVSRFEAAVAQADKDVPPTRGRPCSS